MKENIPPLRITEQEGDTIEVYLTPDKTPEAYQRKIHELVYLSGMSREEAENYLSITPVPLELFYDIDRGLFAVESGAAECCEVYNPFTGKEIPNENLPPKEEPTPHIRLDTLTNELTELEYKLREVWEIGEFARADDGRIDEARNCIEDALSQLQCIGDPEED